MKAVYFNNINILWGFAAISVCVYHIIELLPWSKFPVDSNLALWFWVGWMGVDLFFVISGFVISLSAIRLFRDSSRPFARTYLRHRSARIMPLYFLTGFVFILFTEPQILSDHYLFVHLITHALFIHNIFPLTHGSIDGANWSVGTEFQFYILILLTLPWLVRINPWLLLCGGLAISWGFRAAVYFFGTWDHIGALLLFIYTTQLPGMLDEFSFGIFLSHMVLRLIDRDSGVGDRPYKKYLYESGWFWVIGLLVVFPIAWKIYWPHATYWNTWWMVVFWRSLLAFSFFFLVGSAVFVRFPEVFQRYFFPPFLYLGEISYGIYLWQLPVIEALKRSGVSNPVNFTILTIFFVIVLASISWHFIERPLIKKYR